MLQSARHQPRPTSRPRLAGTAWPIGLAVLAALCLTSVAVGSRPIPPAETWRALTAFDPGRDADLLVRELRLPRTMLGIAVGAALGLAGALMQALTRNPLAEPGILGVNSGAAAAVAAGLVYFRADTPTEKLWLGFAGAAAASAVVFLIGRAHDSGTNPVRLVLAGAGLSVMLGAVAAVIVLTGDERLVQKYYGWASGSLEGRGYDLLPWVIATLALATVATLPMSRALDSMALGVDVGRVLGVRMRSTWIAGSVGIFLLAGVATAAAGPIAFLGLAAPHVARMVIGPAHLRLLPFSMLLGAVLLLVADICGRIVARPGEVGAGVMSALVGAPFFIVLARRRKLAKL